MELTIDCKNGKERFFRCKDMGEVIEKMKQVSIEEDIVSFSFKLTGKVEVNIIREITALFG